MEDPALSAYEQSVKKDAQHVGINEEVPEPITPTFISEKKELSDVELILNSLAKEQESVPQNKRGLEEKLQELQERIKQDPSMVNDEKTKTELVWLLEDWEKFSGTYKKPPVSPKTWNQLNADYGNGKYPGLVNEDLKNLLKKTPDIYDQNIILDIRKNVMEIASKSIEEQTSLAIQQLVEKITNSITAVREKTISNQPSAISNEFRTIIDSQSSENNLRQKDASYSKEAMDTGYSSRLDKPFNPSKIEKMQPRQDALILKQGSFGAAMGRFIDSAKKKFEENTSTIRQENDRKHIHKNVQALNEKIKIVREDLNNLKIRGHTFFKLFEKNVQVSGLDATKVIEGMKKGGDFERLRMIFDKTLSRTEPFEEAWAKLEKSSKALSVMAGFVMDDARQRGMSDHPEIIDVEKSVGRLALSLESIPGREAGENFLKGVSEALQKIADKFREFFSHERQAEHKRDETPAPSM